MAVLVPYYPSPPEAFLPEADSPPPGLFPPLPPFRPAAVHPLPAAFLMPSAKEASHG